jgi:hypothetical protein
VNVHVPTEDKIDGMKNRFYEELEDVFVNFLKYHMKLFLGDFNKVGKEDIFSQSYWVFGRCSWSGILRISKHNVSKTGSVSVLK